MSLGSTNLTQNPWKEANVLDFFRAFYPTAWGNIKVIFVALLALAALTLITLSTVYGIGGWEKCAQLINQMSQTERLISVGVLSFLGTLGIAAFYKLAIPVLRKRPDPVIISKIKVDENSEPSVPLPYNYSSDEESVKNQNTSDESESLL